MFWSQSDLVRLSTNVLH